MSNQTKRTRAEVLDEMVDILRDMTAEWDNAVEDDIGEDTRLIEDLGFESIDVVQLVVAIEERYKRRDLPFQEVLMIDGRYQDELCVASFVDFLVERL